MIIGFTKIYVDDVGYPSIKQTQWIANAFVLFGFTIYIGKVRHESELR